MDGIGLCAHRTRIATVAAVLAILGPAGAFAQGGPRALAQAYNASGQDLFKRFSAAPGNIVFSPYSIGTAMAMTLAGARGETERDMASVLKQRLARDAMIAANVRMAATLTGYDKSEIPLKCPQGMRLDNRRCVASASGNGCTFPARREGDLCAAEPSYPPSAKLAIANALMLTQSDGPISPAYIALLKDKYGAEVFQNAGLAEVNDWVNRKTQGKIASILDELDRSTAAVILNAVYFKAKWATAFRKDRTTDDMFNLTMTEKVTVPMMRRTGDHALVAGNGYRAIRLPYEVAALGMVIVLPDAIDGLKDVGGRLDASDTSKLFSDLRQPASQKSVDVGLPRFKVEYKADLAAAFKEAGMARAFGARADFSGMTGRPASEVPLSIDQIVHRAIVEVMEDGTEAAAATAVTMVLRSAQPNLLQPERFHIDRPFLFYIVDDGTGAILFQGRIADPRTLANAG